MLLFIVCFLITCRLVKLYLRSTFLSLLMYLVNVTIFFSVVHPKRHTNRIFLYQCQVQQLDKPLTLRNILSVDSVISVKTYEPSYEIMALFVLRKLILQTHMRSHPVGLDVWFLVGPLFTSIVHVCEQRRLWRDCANAQARLSLRWSSMW